MNQFYKLSTEVYGDELQEFKKDRILEEVIHVYTKNSP